MSTHLIVEEKVEETIDTEINEVLNAEEENTLPDKLQGKSKEELADMYINLESKIGSQGNELGELRRLTDQILQNQFNSTQQESDIKEEISDEDFYDNPKEAVSKAVDNTLKNDERLKKLDRMEEMIWKQELRDQHPDFQETVGSQDFTDWVGKSKLRINLYKKADSYDIDSALSLFDLWKEHKEITESVAQEEKKFVENKREKDLKAATSESATTETTTKPVFRRADLIRMRIEDPQKYSAMQPEIMEAYQTGRVK